MDSVELERLERMIRNTPARDIRMERIPWMGDEIYYAYGAGPDGTVYSIWGHKGIARQIEFKEDARVEDIQQILVNDAASFIEMCQERGLIA